MKLYDRICSQWKMKLGRFIRCEWTTRDIRKSWTGKRPKAHIKGAIIGFEIQQQESSIKQSQRSKADSHRLHLTRVAAAVDGCVSAEVGNFLFFYTTRFCRSRTRQTQLMWISLKLRKERKTRSKKQIIESWLLSMSPIFVVHCLCKSFMIKSEA